MTDEMATEIAQVVVAENPAVETAKEREQGDVREFHTFSTGVRGRLKAVSPSLIEAVVSRIKEPPVPIWHDPDKDRDEPNPSDPAYLEALDKFNHERGMASMDAMAMFGVELEGPLPEGDEWVFQLKMVGIEVDTKDKLSKQFAYKRYIALGSPELQTLMSSFANADEGVSGAMRSFRR